MNKFELTKDKISSITCVKLFPEFNEIKIYYSDEYEILSLDNSEHYDNTLNYLNENIAKNKELNMTTSKFFDSCVSMIEKELLLDSSNEKEKIINKFMNDSDFQIEILEKCNLSPLPSTITQGAIVSLICKYASH